MSKPVTNIAASVRQRLTNLSRESNRPFAELLQYHAMERFLYRLSQSKYRERFVLKGALMFVVWETPRSRATKDIDLLAKTDNTVSDLVSITQEICRVDTEPDGLIFDPAKVSGKRIKENADYSGVRVSFEGKLERAKVSMQLDIGFGDSITPAPAEIHYPVLLDQPAPRLKGYPPETVVAEKFEAAVKLGMVNTRMKDFYDLWLMSRQFDFDGLLLAKAVKATFARRGTELTTSPTAFTAAFYDDALKQTQWEAFLDRSELAEAPRSLRSALESAKALLVPLAEASIAKRDLAMRWKAPGPWRA